MTDETLVQIGRYLDPAEAQLVKGMLESAGMECFLSGANANAIYPMAFKVKLSVRASDEAEANLLLAEVGANE